MNENEIKDSRGFAALMRLIRPKQWIKNGYYWITGRVDDVLNVSGHRLGTAEVESALVAHEHVAEAAVVGMPHDIRGRGICVFVTLQANFEESKSCVMN